MNFLSFFRSKDTKDKIAKLLKTNKAALEAFNASYEKNILSDNTPPDNYFDLNSRQAADMNAGVQTEFSGLDDIINRIVQELIHETSVWSFDGKRQISDNLISENCKEPVTNEELLAFPEAVRPQLTGTLMKRDIGEPAYLAVLSNYMNYMDAKDPKEKKMFYNLFRQGLDILDLDSILYDVLGMNQNSMGFWLPNIVDAVVEQGWFKIPKTTIIKVPLTMLQLTRLEYGTLTRTTLDIVDKFCFKVFNLDEDKDYFIKTGTYSSKFDFRNALVHGPKEVRELGEYLLFIHNQANLMAGPLSQPTIYGVSTTNEWVVREFIPDKENNPTIYKGLPLHTEYRVFVDFDTDEVIGINPYWDPDVMKKRFGHEDGSDSPHMVHDYVIYTMHEDVLTARYENNKDTIIKKLQEIIPLINLPGQWSIDIMQNDNDFWIIDMAIAANSALNKCVGDKLKIPQENWLPEFCDKE